MKPTITAAEAWQCPACGRWNAAARSACVCGRPRGGYCWAKYGPPVRMAVPMPCPTAPNRAGEAPSARRDPIPRVQTRKPRDRTPRPANQAEAEWLTVCRVQYPGADLIPHGMTVVFPDGDHYTPDVLVSMRHANAFVLYEVKGSRKYPGWEQGMERFKRAKAQFPWLELRLAEKRDGLWYVDGVLFDDGGPER